MSLSLRLCLCEWLFALRHSGAARAIKASLESFLACRPAVLAFLAKLRVVLLSVSILYPLSSIYCTDQVRFHLFIATCCQIKLTTGFCMSLSVCSVYNAHRQTDRQTRTCAHLKLNSIHHLKVNHADKRKIPDVSLLYSIPSLS